MTFNEYQDKCFELAYSPEKINYKTLPIGLMSEFGELADLVYKIIIEENIGEFTRELLALELGDILWYIAVLSREFGFDLSEIAEKNQKKLTEREKCREKS